MAVGDAIVSAKEHRKRAEQAERKYGTCSECDGTGIISVYDEDEDDYIDKTCPRCNGTGKVR